jgi:hypothetical protein
MAEKGPHRKAGASGRALTPVLRVGAGNADAPTRKRRRASFCYTPRRTVRRRTENFLTARRIIVFIDLASVIRRPAEIFVYVVSGRVFQHPLVEVDKIAALALIVLQCRPWQRMIFLTDAEEAAKRHEAHRRRFPTSAPFRS